MNEQTDRQTKKLKASDHKVNFIFQSNSSNRGISYMRSEMPYEALEARKSTFIDFGLLVVAPIFGIVCEELSTQLVTLFTISCS